MGGMGRGKCNGKEKNEYANSLIVLDTLPVPMQDSQTMIDIDKISGN